MHALPETTVGIGTRIPALISIAGMVGWGEVVIKTTGQKEQEHGQMEPTSQGGGLGYGH